MRSTRHRILVGNDAHKFSCAHMTIFPNGTKERLHGHNFQVTLALELHSIDDADFVDIGDLKMALEAQCNAWREYLLLPENSPSLEIIRRDEREVEFALCKKHYVLPADEVVFLPVTNVVVETLAMVFAKSIADRLSSVLSPKVVAGMEVTVFESRRQGGSYYWTPENA